MIPGKIFTGFAEFQRIVSVNDFRLPIGLQELLQASLRFLWSFCFARIRLDPYCLSVIVSRFAIVTEDFVICCYQVTKIFSTRYGSAIASSARGSCNCPLTDFAISVLMEMSINSVSLYWNFIIHQMFPWILAATPGSKNSTGCPVLSRFPFYLVFGFYWLGFHQVALIYHQPKLTLALERCHCESHLLVLESKFHLL